MYEFCPRGHSLCAIGYGPIRLFWSHKTQVSPEIPECRKANKVARYPGSYLEGWPFVKMHPVRSTVSASERFCLRNRSEVHAIWESEFRFETAIELLSAWSHLILQSWLLSAMRMRFPEANKKLFDSINRIALLSPVALIEDVPTQHPTKDNQAGPPSFCSEMANRLGW